MAYTSWRGLVGGIKPSATPGTHEDIVRLLPDGVGFIPLHMHLPEVRGPARLEASRKQLDEKVALLAEQEVDLILPEGTAAYMIEGVKSERALVAKWEKRHKIPVVPTGLNLVHAMKAMKLKRVIGLRPFTWEKGADFTGRYFRESGFDVLTIASPEGHDYRSVGDITPHEVYRTAKKAFLAHPGADGLFTVAGVMRCNDIVQAIEDDLGIPVISTLSARIWEIQKQLCIRQPIANNGSLLSDLP